MKPHNSFQIEKYDCKYSLPTNNNTIIEKPIFQIVVVFRFHYQKMMKQLSSPKKCILMCRFCILFSFMLMQKYSMNNPNPTKMYKGADVGPFYVTLSPNWNIFTGLLFLLCPVPFRECRLKNQTVNTLRVGMLALASTINRVANHKQYIR